MLSILISKQDINNSFKSIADTLLNYTCLCVNEHVYRLTEIEFYYYQAVQHPDEYVHKSPYQLCNGGWYFHWAGIDITIGNEATAAYGGVLIRGIMPLLKANDKVITNQHHIYGPLKVQQQVFSHFNDGGNKVGELHLSLQKNTTLSPQMLCCAPRVGLNPKKSPVFAEKPYRWLIFPALKHAQKQRMAAAMSKTLKQIYTESRAYN